MKIEYSVELSVVCKRLSLNGMALNQVIKRFCVEDEEDWAQHGALQNILRRSREGGQLLQFQT